MAPPCWALLPMKVAAMSSLAALLFACASLASGDGTAIRAGGVVLERSAADTGNRGLGYGTQGNSAAADSRLIRHRSSPSAFFGVKSKLGGIAFKETIFEFQATVVTNGTTIVDRVVVGKYGITDVCWRRFE